MTPNATEPTTPSYADTLKFLKQALAPLKARYGVLCTLPRPLSPADLLEREYLHAALTVLVPYTRALSAYIQTQSYPLNCALRARCKYAQRFAELRLAIADGLSSPVFTFLSPTVLTLPLPTPVPAQRKAKHTSFAQLCSLNAIHLTWLAAKTTIGQVPALTADTPEGQKHQAFELRLTPRQQKSLRLRLLYRHSHECRSEEML